MLTTIVPHNTHLGVIRQISSYCGLEVEGSVSEQVRTRLHEAKARRTRSLNTFSFLAELRAEALSWVIRAEAIDGNGPYVRLKKRQRPKARCLSLWALVNKESAPALSTS